MEGYIIDKAHPDKYDSRFFETTQWHEIGDNIAWRLYKHWGSGVLGAQGCTRDNGDRSGCLVTFGGINYVSAPIVVEARWYARYHNTDEGISAVFSYPGGLSAINAYFWEIYDFSTDIERFTGEKAEEEMEQRIRELLAEA